MSVRMEVVTYAGWKNCLRLTAGRVELVVTTDVGPRIIRLGFVGGQNLFHVYPETAGKTGDKAWQNYGGHRLWHAPEVAPRTYWPDNSYAIVGTDETAIVGYRRMGEYLAIIKEDNGQDSTVFLRSGAINSDGEPEFTVKPCLSGAGGVTHFGFGNIGDEQLILTGNGVYALTTNSLTAERIVQNRSYRVDPKLKAEDLTDAVTASARPTRADVAKRARNMGETPVG